MAIKAKETTWERRARSIREFAQTAVAIVTLASVPVGAYLYLLNSINALRLETRDSVAELGAKIDGLAGKFDVFSQRQDYQERRAQELRDDLALERLERTKELREMRRQGQVPSALP